MNDCKRAKTLFPEALYSRLQGEDRVWFEEHRKVCSRCNAAFLELSESLQFMSQRQRTDPGPEYWDQYWSRLEKKLPAIPPRVSYWHVSGWLQAAAAVVLVLIGVWIGKIYFGGQLERPVVSLREPAPSAPAVVPARPVSIEDRAQSFLERSEVLLIGIVRTPEDPESEDVTDFKREREVSRELIQQASVLKEDLSGPEQQRMRRLITDLEVILLQIANLESQKDYPEVELVKEGVDHKAILFKINLEQMRLAGKEEAGTPQERTGRKI